MLLGVATTLVASVGGLIVSTIIDDYIPDHNLLSVVVIILVEIPIWGLFFLFLRRQVLQPLAAIVTKAEHLRQGDYGTPLFIHVDNELDELARTIDQASQQISEFSAELKQEVNNKTAELAKFKLAVDHSYDQIVITDADGLIIYANPRTTELTGFTIPEVIGTKAGSLWGGLMSQDFYAHMWQVIKADQKPFKGTMLNHRKSGERYYAEVAIAPIVDEQHRLKFFVSVERDVSVEREYARNLSEMAAIVLNSADAIIGLDLQGRITKWNEAAERMYGYTKSEVLGQSVDMFYPPTHKSDFFDFLQRIKSGERVKNLKVERVRKDGTKFFAGLTISPIYEADSPEIVGLSVTARDITQDVEIDRMKTEFISMASHQLRTPLTSMKWFSEMLLDGDAGPLNPEQHTFVQNISTSNQRMIELVNALLNISRIESGRLMVQPQPTNIIDLISSVTHELEVKTQARGQKMALQAPDQLPLINIDPGLVRNVFQNLYTNSIKYSPSNSTITTQISLSGADMVIDITDTGYGIPVSEQSRVFEKFYRGSNVVKKETDGTGLGLYLVKAVVDASGGKVTFRSSENQGTTFTILLPLNGSVAKTGEVGLQS